LTLLALDGVSSFYEDFQALFDIDLEVEEGEVVAIIGANGAGKSTLLGSVAGSVPKTAGSLRFAGREIGTLPAHARVELGISLVPEGRRIFPSLSAEENLLVGAYCKRPGAWSLAKVYELFPLLSRVSRSAGWSLSGGEQQALAVGRALMANPRLLLLDEVSLGLAPVVVKQLYEAIPSIVESGTTILLVEQDIGQALRSAGRVYCLLEGRISLQGPASELSREQIASAYFGV
jgi:branched-chain amino acid transport system ATP-binding protein